MTTVILDTKAFQAGMTAMGQRQFPFAASLAMNRTGEESRDRMRQQVHLSFTVRTGQSAKFLEQQIQVTERSTKNHLAVTVGARGPGAMMLTRHEKGGARIQPFSGPFYVPTENLRGTRATVIPRSMYPAALRLKERRGIVGSLAARQKGKRRAFIIQAKHNYRASGIYERFGPRRDEIRLIWAFRPMITLKPRLKFVETVTRVWVDQFTANFNGFFAHAMRTAK